MNIRATISNLLRRLAELFEPAAIEEGPLSLDVVVRGVRMKVTAEAAVGLRLQVQTDRGELIIADPAAVDRARYWRIWKQLQPPGQQILCEDGVPFCPDEL